MEADEYFSTYDALKDQRKNEHAARKQLPLKTSENCGINKIVWSQFDFMTGPELKFVWDVTPSTSISPVNLCEDGSIADAESLIDSSGSNQSVSFEEIDDPLKTELTIFEELEDSRYNYSEMDGDYKTRKYLDDYMTESTVTCGTSSTKTLTMDDSRIIESPGSSGRSLRDEGIEHFCGERFRPVPCDDKLSPCGTFHESMSPNEVGVLGKLLANKYPSEEDRELAELLREKMSSAKSETRECVAHLSEHYELDRISPILNPEDESRRSCMDSGVGLSTHSNLSALCRTPPNGEERVNDSFSSTTKCPVTSSTPPPRDIFELFDDEVDFNETYVADENFVAKCVLAELICNVPHSRCPLQHKLIVSPSRHLLVAAFIFSAQSKRGSVVTHAISFLMNDEKQEWYLDRQSWFEKMVGESVPKMKASLFSEDADDVLVRVTSELTRLMALLSALERYSLFSLDRTLMIKNTLLAEKGVNLAGNRFLEKAISGCLQSQGYTIIVGSDHQFVAKLLNTLAFFIPENLRWCCLRPYRHKYSPYFRIQAVRRAELPTVINSGGSCPWPVCIIDTDKTAVCMSASYQRHRILRARNDSRGVRLILEHSGVMSSSKLSSQSQLELSTCRTIEAVSTFLKRIDLLPMDEGIRSGFCSQLMLYIDNMADAFISYVRDSSRPKIDEKECGTRSRQFNLSECRKALDLSSDAMFNAILARAELHQPDIAEFIYM
ncbi:unnamed protein product [Caenorhabditis bovis]|uniref:Uncharacterized protein n=1 Tax=Caenorhabditis bovis TaxID=2654633 RepID=A0A8S1FBN5_9PELO|nr:unnamed protein product [Caenorhabditis bovis]